MTLLLVFLLCGEPNFVVGFDREGAFIFASESFPENAERILNAYQGTTQYFEITERSGGICV